MAIALRGELKAAWKRKGTHNMISERAMKIQLKMRNSHTTVIPVYAPIEVDEESESENFYEVLQDQIDKVIKKHFLIVLIDFNARVGPNITASQLHGPHNTDEQNKNGTRLVDFCYNNGLEITNTLFPHKRIHQWTWHHPIQKVGHTRLCARKTPI